jgi:Flp pilus assembly protein TadG
MTNETGSLSAFLAVVCFALFVLLGLVVDGGRALAAREAAMNVAEQAARVGASQVSVQHLRWGEVVADPDASVAAAQSYLSNAGYPGTASTIDGTVTVDISTSEPTVILGLIGINNIAVEAQASAIDVHGITRKD